MYSDIRANSADSCDFRAVKNTLKTANKQRVKK